VTEYTEEKFAEMGVTDFRIVVNDGHSLVVKAMVRGVPYHGGCPTNMVLPEDRVRTIIGNCLSRAEKRP
jgi:hypothetical protein